jgi:multidrug efflux pump subunit AcrA (membrane-fusion protein)
VRRDAGGKSYALVVEGGRIARREVTVGASDEQAALVEITAGLSGGETVIAGPASGLEPGQAVTIAGREG